MIAEPMHEVVDMLDKQTRGAILLLRSRGHSLRCISRLLSLSRDSVRKVVRVGSDEPPIIVRPSKLDAHRERIVQMLVENFGGSQLVLETPVGRTASIVSVTDK